MAKKQKAFDEIVSAIKAARAQGIQIVRRPMFDWTGLDKSKPKACDATGALLLVMGYGKSSFTYNGKTTTYGTGEVRPEGWTMLVQQHLGVGAWWLWCFWMGWDYDSQIVINVGEGDTVKWKDDEVSKTARELARRFARWSYD